MTTSTQTPAGAVTAEGPRGSAAPAGPHTDPLFAFAGEMRACLWALVSSLESGDTHAVAVAQDMSRDLLDRIKEARR